MAESKLPDLGSSLSRVNASRTIPVTPPEPRDTADVATPGATPTATPAHSEDPLVTSTNHSHSVDTSDNPASHSPTSDPPETHDSGPQQSGRLTDGHLPAIIGGLCGLLALGILVLVYALWSYRKSRKRQSVLMNERSLVTSATPTEYRPVFPVNDERRKHDTERSAFENLKPKSALNYQNHLTQGYERRVVMPYRIGTFENHAHTPNRVRGNSEKSSRPSFGQQTTWSQENPLPPDLISRQAQVQTFDPNYHETVYNFTPPPIPKPSTSLSAPSPGTPGHYTRASFSSFNLHSQFNQSQPNYPGPFLDPSSARTDHLRSFAGSPSRDRSASSLSENSLARNNNGQASHHSNPYKGNFVPSRLGQQSSSYPIEMQRPVYEYGIALSTEHAPMPMNHSISVPHLPINVVPPPLPAHNQRPIISRLQIPGKSQDLDFQTQAQRPIIPAVLQPASPIVLERKTMDSSTASTSGSTKQIMFPCQRAVKESMFIGPRTSTQQSGDSGPIKSQRSDSPIDKVNIYQNSISIKGLNFPEAPKTVTCPLSSPLPFPGEPREI